MRNPGVRVVVCGYSGDSQQIVDGLPFYLHHGRPVSVFSPSRSPVPIIAGVDNAVAEGHDRGQSGAAAQARHLEYLRMALRYPDKFFLMHEADSFCITPKIPEYDPEVFWGNKIIDPWGHLSPQAPWFFHRDVAQKLIDAAPNVTFDPARVWVDHYLQQLADEAKVEVRRFPDGCCCPMTEGEGKRIGIVHARSGHRMMHSVKDAGVVAMLKREFRA